MTTYKAVLDASAVIAWIFKERGFEKIQVALPASCISAVNLAEVLYTAKSNGYRGGLDDLQASLSNIGLGVVPFTSEEAALVPFVHERGQALGRQQTTLKSSLSLADCACIATALNLEIPVVSGDVLWTALNIQGLQVINFR